MTALARPQPIAVERRRHPRLALSTAGRFVFDDAIEHRCRTLDVSPVGIAFAAPATGCPGQRIVCYLDSIGRFEGRIARVFDKGFAIEISISAAKQQHLAQQLAWTANQPCAVAPGSSDPLAPVTTRAVLCLPDARRVAVRMIGLSPTAASVVCPIPIVVGATVALDDRPARVTRVTRTVVGMRFDGPLPGTTGNSGPTDRPRLSESTSAP